MYDKQQIVNVFDTLISLVRRELDIQFRDTNITSNEMAKHFSEGMKEALNLAYTAPIRDIEVEIQKLKLELLKYEKQKAEEELKTMAVDRSYKMSQRDSIIAKMKEIQVDINLKEAQKEEVLNRIKLGSADIKIKEEQLKMAQYDTEIKKEEIKLTDIKIQQNKEQTNLISAQKTHTLSQKILVDAQSKQTYEQTKLVAEDLLYKRAQKCFVDRQIKGFDDNVKFKLLDSQFNAWGIAYSSGMLEDVPTVFTNNSISTLYYNILNGLGTCTDCYKWLNVEQGCEGRRHLDSYCTGQSTGGGSGSGGSSGGTGTSTLCSDYLQCDLFGDGSGKVLFSFDSKLTSSTTSGCPSKIWSDNGNIGYIDGHIDKALQLNDNTATSTVSTGVNPFSGGFAGALSFWTNPKYAKGLKADNDYFVELADYGSGNKVYCTFNNNHYVIADTITDAFHNFVFNYNGNGELKVYLDGTLAVTINETINQTDEFVLESDSSGCNAIDQLRTFNRYLNDNNIACLSGESTSGNEHQQNDYGDKTSTDVFKDGSGKALFRFEDTVNSEDGVYSWQTGSWTYQTGHIDKSGKCSAVDGISQNVNVFNGTGGSISFWLKLTDNSTITDILWSGDTSTGYDRYLKYDNGDNSYKVCYGSDSQAIIVETNSHLGDWVHWVITEDANGTKVYMNGVLKKSVSDKFVWSDSTLKNSMLGRAEIDQLRLFTKALSNDEISYLYNES